MKYHCCACKRNSRTKLLCSKCGSEDVFDKTKPDWPCGSCNDPSALFNDLCESCKETGRDRVTVQLVVALMDVFGLDVTDPYEPEDENPLVDYGDAAHKVFLGIFGKEQRLYGDARL
jgi:hypothetical protein